MLSRLEELIGGVLRVVGRGFVGRLMTYVYV